MAPPQFSLDALSDSITSGKFIDTKFYVFTRRDASGRVYAPRALYCNSRVLDTVPYFSSLFSDGFSEGQTKDIRSGFPTELSPYTEDYDYMSDSDLEDGEDEPNDEGGLNLQRPGDMEDIHNSHSDASHNPSPPPSSIGAVDAQNDSAFNNLSRIGKVAIIRDIGAVTFQAFLYFLYSGDIHFALLSSDPRQNLPAQARVGDWITGKLPSPSAKSIYRLADKYDIPDLKERAKRHICSNLEQCDIVEEIFSSFTYFFPEILSIQVSTLIKKMDEESKNCPEGATRNQLRDKIASLSQPQVRRAADALSMIWTCVNGPLKPPPIPFAYTSSVFNFFSKWHKTNLAFLKSISTGVFIDAQFYAFSKINNGLPSDPKPLFISSIVIEEWGSAIATQTVGIDSRNACLVDGPIDDYEISYGEASSEACKDEEALTYRTGAIDSESHQVVLLISGAWKTWMSLLFYAYNNTMTFSTLDALTNESNSVTQVHKPKLCSPRSMYALATTLGIGSVRDTALKDIKSKLSSSNITQELFSSFAASHKEVMEMEIEVLYQNHPKQLTDYIQRVASEETPFLPITLSLVFEKLIRTKFPKRSSHSDSKTPEGQNVTTSNPTQASSSTSIVASSSISTSNASSSTTPTVTRPPAAIPPAFPISVAHPPPGAGQQWLRCPSCRGFTRVAYLSGGLHCPQCRPMVKKIKQALMLCTGCGRKRTTAVDTCIGAKCRARFM